MVHQQLVYSSPVAAIGESPGMSQLSDQKLLKLRQHFLEAVKVHMWSSGFTELWFWEFKFIQAKFPMQLTFNEFVEAYLMSDFSYKPFSNGIIYPLALTSDFEDN